MSPLVFKPLLKRIRWGGRRLGEILGKPIGPEPDYAESWEIADHGQDQSIVANGEFSGMTLNELVSRQNLPLLGRHAGCEQFPLLVKFLDASDVLSVQVHPDDRLAKEFDPQENGKTEAWVVLDAAPGSKLYVGLKSGVTADQLRKALDEGTVEPLLHEVVMKAGDCVFVPAGTVHAIGAGILLAEIQQSSDMTFRLYDWGRVDKNGQPRELHIEPALKCIDFDRGPADPIRPTLLPADHHCEELVRSPQFVIQRHIARDSFAIASDNACHVLMALSGSGRLKCGDDMIGLPRGQTVLLPAERDKVTIEPHGEITLLDASLP